MPKTEFPMGTAMGELEPAQGSPAIGGAVANEMLGQLFHALGIPTTMQRSARQEHARAIVEASRKGGFDPPKEALKELDPVVGKLYEEWFKSEQWPRHKDEQARMRQVADALHIVATTDSPASRALYEAHKRGQLIAPHEIPQGGGGTPFSPEQQAGAIAAMPPALLGLYAGNEAGQLSSQTYQAYTQRRGQDMDMQRAREEAAARQALLSQSHGYEMQEIGARNAGQEQQFLASVLPELLKTYGFNTQQAVQAARTMYRGQEIPPELAQGSGAGFGGQGGGAGLVKQNEAFLKSVPSQMIRLADLTNKTKPETTQPIYLNLRQQVLQALTDNMEMRGEPISPDTIAQQAAEIMGYHVIEPGFFGGKTETYKAWEQMTSPEKREVVMSLRSTWVDAVGRRKGYAGTMAPLTGEGNPALKLLQDRYGGQGPASPNAGMQQYRPTLGPDLAPTPRR